MTNVILKISTTLPSLKSTKDQKEGGYSFLKMCLLLELKNGEIGNLL